MNEIHSKPYIPAVLLLIFLAAEAFLKTQVPESNLRLAALLISAFIFVYLLFYFNRQPEFWESLNRQSTRFRFGALIAVVIVLLAAVLRFWKLGTLADGMAWDEAYKGLDALAIRKLGERPIFLDWNAGREALIAYLVAASQLIFDYSILSVRAVLAFFGVLTVLFFYLFCRQSFSERFAIVAAFLMAVSKWHIIHTRYAVRVGLIVFFEIIVLYFLYRAIHAQKRNTLFYILAGALGGLGLYTYIAYRIFPVVVLVFLLDPDNRRAFKQHWQSLAGAVLAATIVAAPLLLFYWENRVSFSDRMQRTAIWNARGTDMTPTELIVDSAIKTLGLYTWRGDAIDRHNVKEEPMLSSFSSGLFLLGFGITLLNFRKRYAFFLLVYWFLTILPGILSVNAPHASRTLGSLAPAMLFICIGFFASVYILLPVARWMCVLFASIILGGNLYTGPNNGLLRYSKALDDLDAKTSALWGVDRDQYRVAQLLNSLGTKVDAYVSPQLYFHSAVEYLTYSKSTHKLYAPGMSFQSSWQQNKVPVVIVQPELCNLWWLRDDDKKRFFKWWAQTGEYDEKRIRSIINRSYVNYSRTTNMNDWRMIESILKFAPKTRELKMGSYSVFVVKKSRP